MGRCSRWGTGISGALIFDGISFSFTGCVSVKLMDAVNAYMAAEEMSVLVWGYDLALALFKLMRVLQADVDFYVCRERELVLKYAATDGGNVRLSERGTFEFRDPSEGPEYERERAELGAADAGASPALFVVRAPGEVKPCWLAALDGFIEFMSDG